MGRPEIPSDIAQMIADFRNHEKSRENISQKLSKPKGRDLLLQNGTSLSAKEAIILAQEEGLIIERGRGKHGYHITSVDGSERISLPMHGGGKDLSTAAARSVLKFIRSHSQRFNEVEP